MRERIIPEEEKDEIYRLVKDGATYITAVYRSGVSIRTVLKAVNGDDYFRRIGIDADRY